jgi:hypothetical protein
MEYRPATSANACQCHTKDLTGGKISFPCLPNAANGGCDWWSVIIAVATISFFVMLACRFRLLLQEVFQRCRGNWSVCSHCGNHLMAGAQFCPQCNSRTAPAMGGSQCSHCGNHLVAGAQFCPQCNGRTDALEPIPDLGGGWPGDSAGSPAPAMANSMPAQSFRHTCSNVSYPP